MDDAIDRISRVQQGLLEQLVNLAGLVTELRASVNVLKLYVATQTNPGDPASALKALQEMEAKLLRDSPDEQGRLRSAEMIQAMREWKKHGGGKHGA